MAERFDRPDVDCFLRELSGPQLTEWLAFFDLEPHGPIRGDLQAGIVASLIANIFLKKGEKPLTPEDFLLKFKPKQKQQTPTQMRRVLMDMVDTFQKRREILAQDEDEKCQSPDA